MKIDNILDLCLYFSQHSTREKNFDNLHEFIVSVDIEELSQYCSSFTDSDYIIRNNKIYVLTLENYLRKNNISEINSDTFIRENSYDTFSVSSQKLISQVMLDFNQNQNKTIGTHLLNIKDDMPFSDSFYEYILRQKKLSQETIDFCIDEINYHKYIYKTFVM